MVPKFQMVDASTSFPSIMVVAGEASADEHGAAVMRALKRLAPSVHIFGVGGAAMRAEGLETLVPAEAMSLAGLTEVVCALPRMFRIMRQLTQAVITRRPSAVMLIDLPDFNMRLAKRVHHARIPVVYYISPQVWAWRQKRVEHIRRYMSKMLVILPFEKTFYEQHGVPVEFVGHPLLDALPAPTPAKAEFTPALAHNPMKVIALLPGSRHKEVTRHLPIMLDAVRLLRQRLPHVHAIIPVASTIPRTLIEAIVHASNTHAQIIDAQATTAITAADAAIVCSGTATLQTALLLCPMVIVYKVSWLTYHILKRLIRVPHIGMVNLIAGKRIVPELVQHAMTAENIADAIQPMLADDRRVHTAIVHDLAHVRTQLQHGGAATQVAHVLKQYIDHTNTPAPSLALATHASQEILEKSP